MVVDWGQSAVYVSLGDPHVASRSRCSLSKFSSCRATVVQINVTELNICVSIAVFSLDGSVATMVAADLLSG